ncbi:FAD/NAD(P)-binding oxidoreductase [Candidatus Epulonipiscium fishelsonii]|uniref:FAD/NAD(P)-binding oxidoreductase n=1 Tax=Candidatus Epulonipiscium fishelsonii TaxID=77094 RepID=A0ACC8XEV8_9FIRM|nr:FAD/NAD(P)-binding oxidoreductase [Epulopiscium sp. SCG-B11WGA-EpuloA1]ONI42922.1 FAD/NAD(P)-binding oxidoreductase [Epulopiscium sp. SCG-B05WGA-EpuloA1]
MGEVENVDVLIVGGGVIGCGAARELSKYELNILVVEKSSDISEGTTKCNNGMIHSGYDTKPNSLKAIYGVKGNAMYTQWAEELGFHFNRTGSFVCGFNQDDMDIIQGLYENGIKNKVPGIEVISGERAREIEPNINDGVIGALWTPSAGYVEPYEVTLALAENAIENGAKIWLNTEVFDVLQENGKVTGVVTNKGIIKAKVIINSAGLYADEIAKMINDEFYTIHPRRGTLGILDKENKGKLHTFVGKAPSKYTKGGGPQETPEGTLLIGPSAKEVADKEDLGVDRDDLDFILDKAMELTKNISPDTLITFFSGNRAATFEEDFIIEPSKKVKGFIHVAGIQSPGLASAPAISEAVMNLTLAELGDGVKEKATYNPKHTFNKAFRDCTNEEREKLIAQNPAYGKIVCRCETVTEAEIVNAINGIVPATTMDAVKRRTRAGMGRCQSGFCGSKVLDLLSKELNIPPTEVTLKGKNSEILTEPTRNFKRGEM